MYVSIIAPNNKAGLEKDRNIITKLLEDNGYRVEFKTPYEEYSCLSEGSELSIFLEFYDKRYLNRKNILIPNQEWFFSSWLSNIKDFDAIFCKTHYSFQIFKQYHHNVIYTGFTSLDFYDETICKRLTCFHANGKSGAKGTTFILDAWQTEGLPELYLVSNLFSPNATSKSLVHHYNFLGINTYKELMNKCLVHIVPSQVEGFGHCLNEARSCGAVVITTDYPPMNEFVEDFLISPISIYKLPDRLGEIVYIDSKDIIEVINDIVERDDLLAIGKKNRMSYLKDDRLFRERFIHYISSIG